jgi:hypothetical protein
MAFTFHCAAWSATCMTLAQLGINWSMASTPPADGGVKLLPLLPPSPAPAPPAALPPGRMLVLSTPGARARARCLCHPSAPACTRQQ